MVLYLLKDQCPRRASSTRTRKSSRSTIHMPKNKSRDTAVPTEKEISSALETVINWSCSVKACEGGATAEAQRAPRVSSGKLSIRGALGEEGDGWFHERVYV